MSVADKSNLVSKDVSAEGQLLRPAQRGGAEEGTESEETTTSTSEESEIGKLLHFLLYYNKEYRLTGFYYPYLVVNVEKLIHNIYIKALKVFLLKFKGLH
jgi:hypothetical protein